MNQDQPRYFSFLLRMWRVQRRRGWQWRASLESPGSGERRLFPSLEHMIAYLWAQTRFKAADNSDEETDG